MAQSLREDRWYPSPGAVLPPEVQGILDTATAAGVNLIPYIYPILGWHTADPSWRQDPSNNNSFCTLEHQEYNEFMIDTIANFSALSGSRGAGFDFTYLINCTFCGQTPPTAHRPPPTNPRPNPASIAAHTQKP